MISPGDTLAGRFELRRRIGSGGMGEVFEAFDRDVGEVIAVKTLVRADGDTLTRFKREFRALQSTSHPNLVGLRELVRDGQHWFLTMELVRGRHFLEHVRGNVDRLRAALRQLVQALGVLHESGLIHRDIKPSNVMVTDADDRVVLLDFGLITTMDQTRQSTAGKAIGTVEYMAPEQAVGKPVTEAADWYSVGVMLYEALTGDVPHTGHPLEIMIAKQQREPRPVTELAPDAPTDLAALCMALLAIDPDARPSRADIAKRLGISDSEARRVTPVTRSSSDVFVGREQEIAQLEASFERGEAAVHLVVGESGIGKSELVARFARWLEVEHPDTLVLHGRCYERESVPYKAFDGVADGLAQHLSQIPDRELASVLPRTPSLLVRLFPVFMRIESIAASPAPQQAADAQEQRRRAFRTLRELLTTMTTQRRIVITIDDLQWADADSFLLLRELLRGADAPHVLVVATARPIDAADTMPIEAIVERLNDINVTRTNLGPLSDIESRALAERLAPGLSAKVDVARIAREAGGHPMFLAEVLRHLDNLGEGAVTATLDAALTARAAMLPDDARRLLELVCVAGAPISLDVASTATKLDSTALVRAIAALRVASLAREVQRSHGLSLALEPFHDRVRESITGRIPLTKRQMMHAQLANALEASGEQRNPQLLLRHFMLADQRDRAARYAEEAAAQSHAAHAFDQAARLWRIALDITHGDDEERRRLRLRLGEALVAAGNGAEAAEAYLAAAEGADRATRLVCHRHVAEQLLISGHIERGVEFLQTLLAEIGVRTASTPKRTLLSLLRRRALLRLRGLGFKPRDRSEISDAEILRLEVLQLAGKGLSVVDSIRGADFQTRALLSALRSGLRPYIAHSMVLEGMHQATQSNPKRAAEIFQAARDAFGREPDDMMTGLNFGGEGMAAYMNGNPTHAHEVLQNAITAMRRVPGGAWELSSAKLFLMFNLRLIGDYKMMRTYYDQYLIEAQQRGDRYVESTMRRVCVGMWLAENTPAAAHREIERATWGPATAGFHVQHFHELVAIGEIALYTGVPVGEARMNDSLMRLSKSLLLQIKSIRMQHAYLLGRLAITENAPASTIEKHARVLDKVGTPVALIWARMLRAGSAVHRGDRTRAASHLQATAQAADKTGMQLVAAVARFRIGELEGDTKARDAAAVRMRELGVRIPDKMAGMMLPTAPKRRLVEAVSKEAAQEAVRANATK